MDLQRRAECSVANDYDGNIGVRISAVFVVLVGSSLGVTIPVFLGRRSNTKRTSVPFLFAKFFGSGVIVATAFIHLLVPASEALGDPCLTGPITEFPWVQAIALMAIFAMFIVEFMTMRIAAVRSQRHDHSTTLTVAPEAGTVINDPIKSNVSADSLATNASEQSLATQLTAIFILEFGIIFHSVFIGLTLAVSGEEFTTLYIVLVFHQTFEGLGLGSRLSVVDWPPHKKWTPYILGMSYALSTPIAIAIGLGLRNTYAPGSATALMINGVFDSISAGILIYTGLVELMAHEFLFSEEMLNASNATVAQSLIYMVSGAGLMALLGKWA